MHQYLGVIGLDTSGQIKVDGDVWIVAIRNDRKRYIATYINAEFQTRYRGTKNWVEKLYGVLFYKTSILLIKSGDSIVIDKDFQGSRAQVIRQNMEHLFTHFERWTPEINFITMKGSKQVREAHTMTKKARYKEISVIKNPPITREFDHLESRR